MIYFYVACVVVLVTASIILVRRALTIYVDRGGFDHWVLSLMRVQKDGGTLTIAAVGSRAMLRFERSADDSENSCVLYLDVPRTSWSERKIETISAFLSAKGIDWSEPLDRKNVILRVRTRVPDIWNENAGVDASRLAREIFDAAGVPSTARFKISSQGENSMRLLARKAPEWREGESAVLRFVARQAIRGIEAEKKDRSSD